MDVESIRHPKNELKALFSGFDEIADGERIIKRIDVGKALANPEWAVALRTLMGWCARALGIPWGRGTGFLEGALCSVTKAQVES